jgi:glycosyltransferase involved in cell wall biosynthesis
VAYSADAVRVLHVSQPIDAGVAKVVAGLVRDQRRRGWDVTVACPGEGWLPDAVRVAGARVEPWQAGRSPGPSVPSEIAALARVVSIVDPAVVHLHSAKAGLAGRLAVRGRRPTVFQPHAWSFEAVTGPLHVASRWWEQIAQRWTHLTVCVSEAELSMGRDAGITGSAVVVPNGVDPDEWPALDRAACRRELGVAPEGAPLVVCVGRLARQKGQDLLVQAWSRVRSAVPEARLALVGSGPDEADLRASADASVRFAPGDRVAQWYAAADVVVVPSRWEAGLPLVAMEAMVSHRSVVAFDVAGIGLSLPSNAGAVVPSEDVDALADELAIRLLDPARVAREGDHGHSAALTRFSAATSYSRTADHVLTLLEAP